jgi:hypothetical protein
MKQLVRLMEDVVTKEGQPGKLRLGIAVRKGERTIDRYMKQEYVPTSEIAYQLALACGVGEKEALAIAREASKTRVDRRRTA